MDLNGNPLNEYLFPGLEAVDFQTNSKLGSRLTKMFQDAIDFRDNLEYPPATKEIERISDLDKHVKFRISKVRGYVEQKLAPEFKKIVKEEAGLDVERLETLQTDGHFAVYLTYDNAYQAITLEGQMTSTSNQDYTSDEEGLQEMMSMYKNLDLKTSKLSSSKYSKGRLIKCIIVMNITLAFLPQDYYMLTVPSDMLTAPELTAIYLHEIGHVLTVIEHMGDRYATWRREVDYIHSLKKVEFIKKTKDGKLDASRAQASLNAIGKYLDILSKEKSIPGLTKSVGILQDILWSMLTILNRLLEEYLVRFTDLGWVLEYFNMVVKCCIMSVQYTIVYLIMSAMSVSLCVIDTEARKQFFHTDRNYQGTKSSDTMTNSNNLFMLERWADEFVVRHGYGAYQASALRKIDAMFSKMVGFGPVQYYINRYNPFYIIFQLYYVVLFFHLNPSRMFLDPVTYENDYKRIYRLLQDQYAWFKTNTTPGPVMDDMLNQIVILKDEMDSAKRLVDYEFVETLTGILQNLANPIRWMTILNDANLRKDIANLENRLDDLRNNPLYAIGASIRSRRRK